jgi:hypothetical protein
VKTQRSDVVEASIDLKEGETKLKRRAKIALATWHVRLWHTELDGIRPTTTVDWAISTVQYIEQ